MPAKSKGRNDRLLKRLVESIFEKPNWRDLGITQTFVVGVDSLREILQQLSSEKDKWWVKKETANSLILGHIGPQNADTPQVAPFLVCLAKVDKDTACLFTAQKVVQPGRYLRNGKRVRDWDEDNERFWVPLNREISRRYRRKQFERGQKHSMQRIKRGPIPTWEDCLTRDNERRGEKTDAQMLQRLLASDSIDYPPDRVLANESKWIGDVREFTARFRELLQAGCKAGTLAQTLGYFESYRSARRERHQFRFPSRPKLRKLAENLKSAASEIGDLQFWYDPPSAVLTKDRVSEMRKARDEIHIDPLPPWWSETDVFENLHHNMEVYASILELWQPPRSDSIRAYGVIAPCVYAEVATGKPHYRLAAELLSAYSGEEIDEVFDENLLSKRVTYFRESFPEAFKLLRSELEEQHQHQPYYPETNYESLLNAL